MWFRRKSKIEQVADGVAGVILDALRASGRLPPREPTIGERLADTVTPTHETLKHAGSVAGAIVGGAIGAKCGGLGGVGEGVRTGRDVGQAVGMKLGDVLPTSKGRSTAQSRPSRPCSDEEQAANWQLHLQKMGHGQKHATSTNQAVPKPSWLGGLLWRLFFLGCVLMIPVAFVAGPLLLALLPVAGRVLVEVAFAALVSAWSDPTGRIIVVVITVILGWKVVAVLREVFG